MSGEKAEGTVRVFVVDDHAAVRRGIRAYLTALGEFEVVAESADGHDALNRLGAMATEGALPHVVLLDLVMPRMDGVTATREITTRYPLVGVVILTSFGQLSQVQAALSNGASACLVKDADPAEVATALKKAVVTPALRPAT
jgi:DNA-binding NarL/FixJ family response regulator